MAELKTKLTEQSVDLFLEAVPDERKRRDSYTILEIMKKVTGEEPRMWGDSIVGFGSQHYQYASGREGEWPITGFSPRKQSLTLYLTYGFERHGELLGRLGKHKVGKACLYVNKLDDVDVEVLEKLIASAVAEQRDAAA